VAWRLVLAARRRPARSPGPQGVRAVADRACRPLASSHIADIVNLFKWQGLNDVCLVAHSYGGWPCSGALEEIGDRVSSIVWLDAFKPENGQKGVDFASGFSRTAMEEAVAKGTPGRKGPPSKAFGVNEKDQAWVDSLLTDQPNGVATQPIRLTGAREKIGRKAYIRATSYPQTAFDRALAECKADPTWKTFVNENTGHDVMIDQPQWLVHILMQVA
jgi:hypothetical protein